MGGVRGQMQISNHLLTNGLTRCDLQKTPVCGRKIHRIEKSGCFYDYTDVIKYSEHILQTTTIQVWHPDTKIDQLPFPKTFNTTTISSNVIKVCEDISVVCHDYKSLDNIWSPFFVCHSKNGTKTYQVTVANKLVHNGVKMIAICHYQTNEFDPNHISWKIIRKQPGAPACHLTSRDTFVLCKKV
ncbi:unnamed protein product [Rotaria sp. Silwood1]|nr:unnamed protein product [Rotaria sp. Silwood1]